MDVFIAIAIFFGNPVTGFIAAIGFAIPCFAKTHSVSSKIILAFVALFWVCFGVWNLLLAAAGFRLDLIFLVPIALLFSFVGVIAIGVGRKSLHHEEAAKTLNIENT